MLFTHFSVNADIVHSEHPSVLGAVNLVKGIFDSSQCDDALGRCHPSEQESSIGLLYEII